MRHKTAHIRELSCALWGCYARLHNILDARSRRETVEIHGPEIRMAVGDFKNILAKIEELK